MIQKGSTVGTVMNVFSGSAGQGACDDGVACRLLVLRPDTHHFFPRAHPRIGAMAYAFGGQVVQNELSAMVRAPPAVIQSLRKALAVT